MSIPSIQKVAVLGAGLRGSQIAAHLANGGTPVLLLDAAGADFARQAVKEMSEGSSPLLMSPRNAQLIDVGDGEEDFYKLKDVDWIIEAIGEDLVAKTTLYDRVDAVRKLGSVVSTASSRFAHATLVEGRSEPFQRDFLLTCFSYPMRTRRLVSFVDGAKTREDLADFLADYCDRRLGRTVVFCKDTPGLIAERLGLFYAQTVVNATHEYDLRVEEADFFCSKIGEGVFKFLDRMGLDKWIEAATPLAAELASNDGFGRIYHEQTLFLQMIKAGFTGDRGKGGFYRSRQKPEGLVYETLNLHTGAYEPLTEVAAITQAHIRKTLRGLMESDQPIGRFAWRVLSQTLVYAAVSVTQMADDIVDIDEAMRFGCGWKWGPFEILDKIGVDWFMALLREDNKPIPAFLLKAAGRSFYSAQEGHAVYLTPSGDYAPIERPAGLLLLEDVRCASEAVARNEDASVWDIGDGILCFTFQTKANTITPNLLYLLEETIGAIEQQVDARDGGWKGLVIYNEAGSFSAGVNLPTLLEAMKTKDWSLYESFMQKGHKVFRKMRYASFPTVVAVKGYAVGGGCEMLLHAAGVQAHAESKIGLVETKIGFVPAWGGALQLMGRVTATRHQFGGDVPPVNYVFETLAASKVSSSAAEAIDLRFLRPSDGITMNEDRLLFDAKQRVLDLTRDYKPPKPWPLIYSGAVGRAALELALEGLKMAQDLLPHDLTICRSLINVLCGAEGDPTGSVTEEQVMDSTHREFMRISQTPATMARIEHFLTTGKMLKN